VGAAALLVAAVIGGRPGIGSAQTGPVVVTTAEEWVAALSDPLVEAIALGLDIEVGCGAGAARPTGSVPVVVDGDDHTLTDGCVGGAETASTSVDAPSTWRDITLVGAADGSATVLLASQLSLERVTVVVRNGGDGVVASGLASTIVDSTIELAGDGAGTGLVVDSRDGLVVDGLRVSGAGDGIDVGDAGVPVSDPPTIRDSHIAVRSIGLAISGPVTIERSSVEGASVAVLVFAQDAVVIRDSTLAVSSAGRALSTEQLVRDVTLDQVTVVVPPGASSLEPGLHSVVTLHATVLAGGTCFLLGRLASEGDNIATDDSCATTGTGDRVLADPGLEPYDAARGWAAPTADGPLVDAVAECGSGADQTGAVRPSGAACDIGAIELQAVVPPSTTTTTTPGGGTAPPATPVVGPARFTG